MGILGIWRKNLFFSSYYDYYDTECNRMQETAVKRDYAQNFPLRELLGVLNCVAIACRPDCRAVKRLVQYLLNTHATKYI